MPLHSSAIGRIAPAHSPHCPPAQACVPALHLPMEEPHGLAAPSAHILEGDGPLPPLEGPPFVHPLVSNVQEDEHMSVPLVNPKEPQLFKPIVDSLLNEDRCMVLAEFESYSQCQRLVCATYKKTRKWNEMSVLNVANMGKFSSDRTIREYADEIWKVKPLPIELDR